jgi:hypothetical protein
MVRRLFFDRCPSTLTGFKTLFCCFTEQLSREPVSLAPQRPAPLPRGQGRGCQWG